VAKARDRCIDQRIVKNKADGARAFFPQVIPVQYCRDAGHASRVKRGVGRSQIVMKIKLRMTIVLVLCVSVLGANRMAPAQEIASENPSKFDEFHFSNWESAMSHLDGFALNLQNNPQMNGVVIVYGAQLSRRGEARAWSACLKSYLISRRGIEPDRVVMINGGYRKDLTVELWVTADKKHLPNPEPHVKPKDVRFKKGKVKGLCEM
jgi:hypothetical protein